MIQIDNNYLIIDKRKIEFDAPISNFIEYNDLIFVVLDYKSKILRNIYAIFKNDGSLKWQVEDTSKYLKKTAPFTSIRIINNNIFAWDWIGWRYILSPESGEIIYRSLGK